MDNLSRDEMHCLIYVAIEDRNSYIIIREGGLNMASWRSRPALDKAQAFCLEFLRTQRLTPGRPLPSIAALASAAGVSTVTMWKAVNLLSQKGLLTVSHGKRITAGPKKVPGTQPAVGAQTDSPAPVITAHKWQRVRQRIEEDVLQGVFANGARLPSAKELTARYSVSHATLRKALHSLCADRILDFHHRWFRVAPIHAGPRTGYKIVMIGPSRMEKGFLTWGVASQELLTTLQMQCRNANVYLEIVLCAEENGDVAYTSYATGKPYPIETTESVFGYLLYYGEGGRFEIPLQKVLARLIPRRKPIAVFTHQQHIEIPRVRNIKPVIGIFPVATGKAPGNTVARYLLGLNHKRIAYISARHGAQWSQNRLQGIQEIYAGAGLGAGSVTEYCLPKAGPQDFTPRPPHDATFRKYIATVNEWEQQVGDDAFLGQMFPTAGRLIYENFRLKRMHEEMLPLYRRAIRDRRITAWVAANDQQAESAILFLRDRNIRIPEQLSIVSFNDSTRAWKYQVSSYNFNVASVAVAMVGFVLGRPPYFRKSGVQVITIDGMVINRSTAAKAG